MIATLIQVPLAVLPLLLQSPTRACELEVLTPQAIEERALAEFRVAVDRYTEMRRRVQLSFEFDDETWVEPERVPPAIEPAQPLAREGDIFTSEVAQVLRDRIDRSLMDRPYGTGHVLMPSAAPAPRDPGPKVNTPFGYVLGYVKWPALVRALPPLPPGLEYALWLGDLVLLDRESDVVVDILRYALPPGAHPGVSYP